VTALLAFLLGVTWGVLGGVALLAWMGLRAWEQE
jgi:hypothetical protein